MKYNSKIHHRRTIRLQGYDYSSSGLYFVTLCTQDHERLFGNISNHKMILNDAGKMVATILQQIPDFYPGNDIDKFIVMPDHIHIIIIVGAGPRACPAAVSVISGVSVVSSTIAFPTPIHPSSQYSGLPLPDIISRIKTMTLKLYSDGVEQLGWQPFNGKLWQRNYYEHIIRNENELFQIREYVINNPANWDGAKRLLVP